MDFSPVSHSRRLVEADLEKVLVCTVATRKTEGLAILKASCKKFLINLSVFGLGEEFRGFGWRLKTLYSQLVMLEPHYNYVLVVDGFDTIFATGLQEIMAKYLAMSTPLVMSAEVNCWPPWGPRPSDYPPAPSRYRFVNAGGYIGQIRYIIQLMASFNVSTLSDFESDQRFWAQIYVSGTTEMQLDYNCEIFQSLFDVQKDLVFDQRVRNRATESTPCIFHGNGNADMHKVDAFVLGNRSWREMSRLFFRVRRWKAWFQKNRGRRAVYLLGADK